MTELDLAVTRATFAEGREIDLTWKLGVYKNALAEIQRRIQNRPSPAILFEIDEIIKKAQDAALALTRPVSLRDEEAGK